MSDTTEPTDSTDVEPPTDSPTGETQVATTVDETTTVDPDGDTFPRVYVEKLRDENARYRTRAGRADELHRRLVETTVRSAAADHLADPGDLLLFTDEADLLDDDGFPDADKIVEAARALVTERPHLAPRRPRGDVGQGATATSDNPAGVLGGILRARAS